MSVWKGKCTNHSKPWGDEDRWEAPWGVYGKLIRLKEGQRTSLKFYKTKNEVLFCLEGRAIVTAPNEKEFGDDHGDEGANFYLEQGKVLFIEKENPYRIKAFTDCVLVEVTHGGHYAGSGAVMLEDDYGRAKNSSKPVSDIIK